MRKWTERNEGGEVVRRTERKEGRDNEEEEGEM